jgi:hypothetical protein
MAISMAVWSKSIGQLVEVVLKEIGDSPNVLTRQHRSLVNEPLWVHVCKIANDFAKSHR